MEANGLQSKLHLIEIRWGDESTIILSFQSDRLETISLDTDKTAPDQCLHCNFLCIFLKYYHKVPKFSDARKLCCNLPKIFRQKDANGIANSEDPDQTAPLGAV